MIRLLAVLMCATFMLAGPAAAQDEPAAQAAEAAPADKGGDYPQRLELAKRMHEIRPAAMQIDNAISQVAQRLPAKDQDTFKLSMKQVLDYKAIEAQSVEAMAEIFTVSELQAMVDYYSRPEAESAAKKYKEYQQRVQPEIIKMLDRAMMQVRTGTNPGSKPGMSMPPGR